MKARGYPTPRERPTLPTPAAPEYYEQSLARPMVNTGIALTFTEIARFPVPSDALVLATSSAAGEFRFLDDTGQIIGSAIVGVNATETIRTRASRVEARTADTQGLFAAATALYRR